MPDNVFEYSVAPNALIDAIRFFTIIVGVVLTLAAMHRWLEHCRPYGSFAFVALGLFTSVQELTVLGEPFYPWRLFLLLVMTLCALTQLYQDHRCKPCPHRVSEA